MLIYKNIKFKIENIMKTIKKNIFPIIVLLVSLAIISYFLIGKKDLDGVRQDLKPAETTISSRDVNLENKGEINKVCYLKKTPSAQNEKLSNVDYVEINYSQNAVVTGFISHIPAGTDSQKGEFVGARDGDFINVIFNGKAEGELIDEQVLLKVSEKGVILPSIAEREEDENGILMYKDITKVSFPEENLIPITDCEKVDKKEVGLKEYTVKY